MKYTELVLVALVLLVFSNACQEQENTVGTFPKAGDTYELGSVLPELRTIDKDTARIALYPYARWFYLDMKMKNSQKYLTMIQTAGKSGRQVKARIFKRPVSTGGEEIAEIY
ncbi:hypothetical protein GCM10028818_37500 [Spirosoma horti]